MPKIEFDDGIKIHYQLTGAEDGEPLVMIHGLTGNLAVWHLHIAPLLQDRYRVLTYDLRGHGYSSMPPTGYTVDDHMEDLRRLLDALDIPKALLVGHSLGADVALYLAANHPEYVPHVVAVEPAMPCLVPERANASWEGWDYWVEALEMSGVEVPPERRNDFEYLMRTSLDMPKQWGPLQGLPRNPKKALKLLDETTMLSDVLEVGSLPLERINEIETPISLVYAEKTGFLLTRDVLMERLPNAEELSLPRTDMGHFGPLEQPDLVAEYILKVADGMSGEH